MDINEGAKGEQVFRVEFADEADIQEFEIIQDGSPYREWCVSRRADQFTRHRDADGRSTTSRSITKNSLVAGLPKSS